MCHQFLSKWNGVSFFLDDDVIKAADMHLYADATDIAYGGIYRNKWFQGKFLTKLIQGDETISMALLELYPIVLACVLWGKDWSRRRVLFNCDNIATVEIINKGRSKVNIIMKLICKLTWCSAINNFTIMQNMFQDALILLRCNIPLSDE